MKGETIHFVTGRLAEFSLRATLEELAPQVGFEYTVGVLPITVAALMRPKWLARRLEVPAGTTRVMIPGYCGGDLAVVQQAAGVPVERGPKDLRQLPQHFGREEVAVEPGWDIEIVAEINHCPQLALDEVLSAAQRLQDAGADVIDIGCDPGDTWNAVAECVWALRDQGIRVSIDSFNPWEIERAVCAGAELVLSVNASNRDAACDWDAELVVVPDEPETLGGLEETIDTLTRAGRRFRIDPILEPIGVGFAPSLGRYLEVRRRYPEAEILMGIGNLTELTDVDSAGINVLLMGFCQEAGIRSVLTTQVINWARTSVQECHLARQLVYRAVRSQVPPKHMEPRLVALRDERLFESGAEALERLSRDIKDRSYRIFAEQDELHLIGAQLHLRDRDPFRLFQQLLNTDPTHVDNTHAFYLGFELAKAYTALQLSKNYRQDQPLDWGYLTQLEEFVRLRRSRTQGSGSDRQGNSHSPRGED
jgi:dihydropteroate synthase-like protein